MTNEEFEAQFTDYNHSPVDVTITVEDVRVLLACIETQEGIFLASGMGGNDDSGIEGMTVSAFYAWSEMIRSMLGTP